MFLRFPREVRYSDNGGSLTVLESTNIPFTVRRLYWIIGITPEEPRGFHAHKNLNQVMTVMEGTVELKLRRGESEFSFRINDQDQHIFIPQGTWREIYSISQRASILVVADCEYLEEDYIRNWNDYINWFSENFNEG
jgi:dTDP-4-dehydrorhamnose 3,5-epimerase-like enzyme